jgi:hypothetical protein
MPEGTNRLLPGAGWLRRRVAGQFPAFPIFPSQVFVGLEKIRDFRSRRRIGDKEALVNTKQKDFHSGNLRVYWDEFDL